MKKILRVTVFSEDLSGSYLSGPPDKFLSWWEEKFKLVPPEFADTARVYCEAFSDDDGNFLSVTITYNRPETEEEEALREAEKERARKNAEIAERKQLEKLKAKYESK